MAMSQQDDSSPPDLEIPLPELPNIPRRVRRSAPTPKSIAECNLYLTSLKADAEFIQEQLKMTFEEYLEWKGGNYLDWEHWRYSARIKYGETRQKIALLRAWKIAVEGYKPRLSEEEKHNLKMQRIKAAAEGQKEYGCCFIQVAKEFLPHDLYLLIHERAGELQIERNGGEK